MCSRFGSRIYKTTVIVAAFALVLIHYSACWAAGVQVISGRGRKIRMEAGKSVIIRSGAPFIRVSSANEKVATVTALSPNQVYVTGIAPGATNITLWQGQNRIAAIYDVEVSREMSTVREKLHELFPGERGLQITAGNDSITLAGTVSSAPVICRRLWTSPGNTRTASRS